MPLTAKTVRSQLVLLKPIINGCSLKAIRRGQNKLGEIMESRHRDGVIIKKEKAFGIDVAWAIPKDRRREGVILYLHGGGYTCGDIEYALGFASMLPQDAELLFSAPRTGWPRKIGFPRPFSTRCRHINICLKTVFPAIISPCAAKVPAADFVILFALNCGSCPCPCLPESSLCHRGRILRHQVNPMKETGTPTLQCRTPFYPFLPIPIPMTEKIHLFPLCLPSFPECLRR